MNNNGTYKVGIYLRLSREDDLSDESKSITHQREIATEYCIQNSFRIVKEYVDDGVSGATDDRPKFQELITDIENKNIDLVITKDTSRLARNYATFTYYVLEYFPSKNVRYISINDKIDSLKKDTLNEGTLCMAFFNELQVRRDSTKIKDSLNSSKRQGKFMGGTPPYGYMKNPLNKYELLIYEEQAEIVRRIFDMSISGMGTQKIADILTEEKIPIPSVQKNLNRGNRTCLYGIWHSKTVRDILKNEDYIGNLTQCREEKVNCKIRKTVPKDRWIVAKGACPAIIDEDKFYLVQDMFLKNTNQNSKSQEYLLRKFIYCKECGHTISINKHKWKKQDEEMVKHICYCNYYKKYPKYNVCVPHRFDYDEFEKKIMREIKKMCRLYLKTNDFEALLKNNDKTIKMEKDLNLKLDRYKNDIEINKSCIDKCYNQNLKGLIDDNTFQRQYNLLIEQNNKTFLLIEEIENKLNNIKRKEDYTEDKYKNVITEFLSMKKPNRQLLSSLIDRIEIDKDLKITIFYRFKPLF